MPNDDQKRWATAEGLSLLGKFFSAVQAKRPIQPGGTFLGEPVDLRGMQFPTAELRKQFDLPSVEVHRVNGKVEIDQALLRSVDLSGADLSFSVWSRCTFEDVRFTGARLRCVRFFGCRFARCELLDADLRDSSFSVSEDGSETEIVGTRFVRCDLRGASSQNPVFRDSVFRDCRLDRFVFDSPMIEGLAIEGKYHELQFRGTPGDPSRNKPALDLSQASIVWLSADLGLDLSAVRLPADGSCIVVGASTKAIHRICDEVVRKLPFAAVSMGLLRTLFSEQSPSSLSPSQKDFLLSRAMIRELDADLSNTELEQIFELVKAVA